MQNWVKAVILNHVETGKMIAVRLNGQNILLVKIGETYYAMLNDCPHLGCLLHKGTLRGFEVTCPCHDWIFDVRTGEFLAAPEIAIPVYPVKTEDGELYVNIGGDSK